MLAGLIVVGALALGVPLAAVWAARRRRLATGNGTPLDVAALSGALGLGCGLAVLGPYQRWWPARVPRRNATAGARGRGRGDQGRELQEERLRAAVVEWATALQARTEARRRAHPRRTRIARAIMVVWTGWLVVVVGMSLAARAWGQLVNGLIYGVAVGLPTLLTARGPRRAIERNSGRPSARG